jgi:regulator of RNase E activity RraA
MNSFSRRKFLKATAAIPGVAAFGILTRPGDAAEFSWRYANNNVPTHPMNIRATEAIAKIKEQSSGRLDIQLFPNNQLGGDTDMLSQIRTGAIQMFNLSGLILATPASWSSPRCTRAALEDKPEGCITIIDAMGVTEAGVFGDILAQRMAVRKVAGLVTDGAMRDVAGGLETGLPVWCQGAAAPASVAGLTYVGWQEPVGCGGCAIFPNDMIVADGDGAVCIPQALAVEVAKDAVEQEAFENWALSEVRQGAKLPGLYPPNEETKSRYLASRKPG